MSARAVPNRLILLNITNMDEHDGDAMVLKSRGDELPLRDAKGVKSGPPPTPPANTTTASPGGENLNTIVNIDVVGKFESGSGSGDPDQDGGQDVAAKKRKTRRGKPKHRKLKPYTKQQLSTYQQRLKYRAVARVAKTTTGRQPPAPYNTTQFLMEDHSDLPDLEQKLSGAEGLPVLFQKPQPPRTRDSSFSVDSDEDYFYSSPEDEEEFLTKEFSSAYEDLHAERLGALTKPQLIQEYIQLEGKVDLLTKRLRGKNLHQTEEWDQEDKNTAGPDSEIAKKLKIYQQRIDDLIQQNEQLSRENESLRTLRKSSPVSSVDSESDSDASTNLKNSSSCSCTGRSSTDPTNVRSKRETESLKGQRRDSQVSSIDSESDSDSSSNHSSCSCRGGSPKALTTPANLTNGHATAQEVNGLST